MVKAQGARLRDLAIYGPEEPREPQLKFFVICDPEGPQPVFEFQGPKDINFFYFFLFEDPGSNPNQFWLHKFEYEMKITQNP